MIRSVSGYLLVEYATGTLSSIDVNTGEYQSDLAPAITQPIRRDSYRLTARPRTSPEEIGTFAARGRYRHQGRSALKPSSLPADMFKPCQIALE
jgi:hypothetical protein